MWLGIYAWQDKRSVVLATECAKIVMCCALLSSAGAWRIGGGSTLRTLGVALVPAALYLIQNLAMQVAYQRLVRVPVRPRGCLGSV